MPQGQAAVSWCDKKDVELFLTVLTVQKITIDYAAVAAAFGPNIPASCIQSRMKLLRKKATEMDFATTPQDSPAKTPNKRTNPTTSPTSANKKAKSGKKGAVSSNKKDGNGSGNNNADDDDDDDGVGAEAKAKKTSETLIHLSSDEAEFTNANTTPQTPSKSTNGHNAKVTSTANGTAPITSNGDETTPTPTPTATLSKRKTPAKPRAPRAAKSATATATAKPKAKPKAKKETKTLSLPVVEAHDLENEDNDGEEGGVEMQFVKEEEGRGGNIKKEVDDEQDGGEGEGVNGVGLAGGVRIGEEDQEALSNGHAVPEAVAVGGDGGSVAFI